MKSAAKTRLSIATGVINIVFALAFLVIAGFAVYYAINFNKAMPESGFWSNLVTVFFGFIIWGIVDILFLGLIMVCILAFFALVATGVITFVFAKKPESGLLKAFQSISVGISASILSIFLWVAFVALWHIDDPGAQTDLPAFAILASLAAISVVCLVTGAILVAQKKKPVQQAIQ